MIWADKFERHLLTRRIEIEHLCIQVWLIVTRLRGEITELQADHLVGGECAVQRDGEHQRRSLRGGTGRTLDGDAR